jgi:outer membrane protein assembly factor BamB/tetratricopeptide (TPR) repeat protein
VVGRLDQPRVLASYLATLGRICFEAGEVETAIEHLEESLRSDASHHAALSTLRDAYAQLGDAERVAEVSLRLARAQADRGELDQAVETCRAGIEQAPQAMALRFFHAQVLARASRVEEAREEMYAVIRSTDVARAATSDKAYELLSSCYRLLLKIDPDDAEAEKGLQDIDRRRMLRMRRKKFVTRGGAAAALLLVLVGVGLATGGPDAEALANDIRKAQQKKNVQRVLELIDELAEAHPDSPEAKWALELKGTLATEQSASNSAKRDQEKKLRAEVEGDLEEVRAAVSDHPYGEAMGAVTNLVTKLNRPELAFLRKTMGPQIEWLLLQFFERVRDQFESDRKQVAAGEVQLRSLDGKASELKELEAKLLQVRTRDWPTLAPELSRSLPVVAGSQAVGKGAEAATELGKRLATGPQSFANLDSLLYTVRRERFRAEILDLHKIASTQGQQHLTDCEFERARELFEAVRVKADEVIDQEPREHFRELLTWLDLRNIPVQTKMQLERIEAVTKTLRDVEDLRKQGKYAAAYRVMRDLVSENRLIQFEKKYKLPYQVVSIPAGAEVEVNGKPVGRAPCEIEMEIGQRAMIVNLRKPGFRDTEARLVPTDPALEGTLRVDLAKDIAWDKEIAGSGVEAHPVIADKVGPPGKERPAVLLATTDASLLALDLASGERVWEASTGLLQRIKAQPAVAAGSAYLITLDGLLHQIRLADGKILDRIDLKAKVEQDPAVHGDTIYVATRKPSLVAVRGVEVLWEQPLAESPTTPVVYLDGKLHVGTTKGAILVHDAQTGASRPEFRVGSGTSFWGGLAVHGSLVLAGAEDGRLYAFDTKAGKQAWAYPTGGPLGAPAASDGKRIYLAARDGYIHVLSAEGQEVDKLDMGYAVKARAAVADGFLYFLGSNRAKAYEGSGRLWWDKAFDGEFPVHVIAGGGRIVIVTDKPWVHALPKDER